MKQWNKRLFAVLTAAVMIVMMTGTAFAAGTAADYTVGASEARSGVVRMLTLFEARMYEVYEDGGNLYKGSLLGTWSSWDRGSAFGVGTAGEETDVFVTNRHVVTPEEGLVELDGEVYYAQDFTLTYYILLDDYAYNTDTGTLDPSRSVPCTVIYVGDSDDADVAVLRAAEPVTGRVALALQDSEDTLEVGDPVTALGFPGISDVATSEGYMLATVDDVTLTDGVVSRFFENVSVTNNDESALSGRLIQSTATINAGNSGGPLLDENGTVVGINTYTVHGGSQSVSNAYYALRIKYAKDALDSLNIDYDVYVPKTGPSRALILIAAIAAVVIVAAVVLAVVLVRRKKKDAQAQPDGAPNDSGYRLQGVSGVMEGKRFRLNRHETVVLGRDPDQCGVVFPANTPGVSGRHCAVWTDGTNVYLKDLGSSHGTFLSSGSRVGTEQPVVLRPGETFCLGSQEQSFVIAERRPQ